MRQTLSLWAAAAACVSALAACQATTANSGTPAPRQVKVLGYGAVTTYPDFAEITVESAFTRPAMKTAVTEVQAVVADVMALARRYAAPADVRVSSITANKDFEYVGNKQKFVGYNSSQSVTVKLTDLRRLENFMEALLALRISGINDVRYGHTRADSLRREAATLALRDARATADKLCATLQVRRGPVLDVDNSTPGETPDELESYGGRSRVRMELYAKSISTQSFKTTPDLLRYTATCQLTTAIE